MWPTITTTNFLLQTTGTAVEACHLGLQALIDSKQLSGIIVP